MKLAEKGSLFATWQALPTHLAKREVVLEMAKNLFEVVSDGVVMLSLYTFFLVCIAQKNLKSVEQGRNISGH